MIKLVQVSHDLQTNTLEATWRDETDALLSRNFSPTQIDEFSIIAGAHAQRYIDLAGWTPEYVAKVGAEEKRRAEEEQALADAEEEKRQQAEKKRFDDAVAAQVQAVLRQSGKQK